MKKILYIIVLLVGFTSCSDFLDVEPKGEVIPESIEDYDLLLAPFYLLRFGEEAFFSADDFDAQKWNKKTINDPNNKRVQLYSFTDRFFNANNSCLMWNDLYEKIYTFNKVIAEVEKAKIMGSYTEEDKKIIKAEAQYNRALMYFILVNFFGKHYDDKASENLTIPLILDANISQKKHSKATIKEVYDLILKDLQEALRYLPKKSKLQNRPNKGAGYALLSRVYLYQSDYQKALKNAQLALQENGQLGNYTVSKDKKEIEKIYYAEQYARYEYSSIDLSFGNALVISKELQEKFEPNDTRISRFFDKDYSLGNTAYPNFLPSISEMCITVAECEARLGNNAVALVKLNELRKNRIPNVVDKTMVDFNGATDKLLSFILDERRRELVCTGARLFEVKRLNLEPNFQKTVVHTIEGKGDYTAEPNSGKLVFPIPANVKKFNEKLQ